jgi:hypothetical protein
MTTPQRELRGGFIPESFIGSSIRLYGFPKHAEIHCVTIHHL